MFLPELEDSLRDWLGLLALFEKFWLLGELNLRPDRPTPFDEAVAGGYLVGRLRDLGAVVGNYLVDDASFLQLLVSRS